MLVEICKPALRYTNSFFHSIVKTSTLSYLKACQGFVSPCYIFAASYLTTEISIWCNKPPSKNACQQIRCLLDITSTSLVYFSTALTKNLALYFEIASPYRHSFKIKPLKFLRLVRIQMKCFIIQASFEMFVRRYMIPNNSVGNGSE